MKKYKNKRREKMTNVKIIYFMILLVLIILLGTELVQAQESMTTQLQMVLEDAVNSPETVFPGALLYVSSPDLGTWAGAAGLGNIETNTAIRSDDKFRAGSIMKPFISVVILQLVEEGQLSLDDPMTEVLPESVNARFANSSQITLRMLLNHTAGMPEWINETVRNEIFSHPTKIWKVDEYLDLAAMQEPYFAPGEGCVYTNTDYNLLGLVIEKVTGHTWRQEVRERIIEKLNLGNTLLPEPGDTSIPGNYFRGYVPINGQFIDVTGIDPSMAGAAGGHALVTTAADLGQFLDAVLAGELFQNIKTLNEMMTFIDTNPYGQTYLPGIEWEEYGYGLGMEKWVLPGGIELIGHAGTTAGFTAAVYYLPIQDLTVVAAMNIFDLLNFFAQLYLPSLKVLVP